MNLKAIGLFVFAWQFSLSVFSQEKIFYFYFASGKNKPSNYHEFKDSIQKWSAQYDVKIKRITAHTDNVGRAHSNQKLSLKRADAVYLLISELNLGGGVDVAGKGEAQPRHSNSTRSGRSKNRRCEMACTLSPREQKPTELVQVPVSKPACEERDTVITLPGGTEIEIKGCSLDGISVKDVRVEAQEFFTRDKMIMNDMYTQTTEGACLSTGGMLNFKISDPVGNPVKLKQNSNIVVRIPQTVRDTAFDLYQMSKNGKGENLGWDKKNEQVKYLREKKKFEVGLTAPVISMNLDFIPVVGNALAKARKDRLKTKTVKHAKTYINGETSVLKLAKYRPRKFKYRNCNCIPENEQFATVVASKKGQIYYCHKPLSELKMRWFFGKKYVVRKSDYVVLASKKELNEKLKVDFAAK